MKCASIRTSALEKFSSSAHLGISAWICEANFIASPRRSRCESCCGGTRSAMARALCRIGSDLRDASLQGAPALHRASQRVEQLHRGFPAEAAVGDALAECQRLAGLELLASLDEVRLDHQPDDAPLALSQLSGDVARHLDLLLVLLGRIGVRAV